jgi:hypothetical protein
MAGGVERDLPSGQRQRAADAAGLLEAVIGHERGTAVLVVEIRERLVHALVASVERDPLELHRELGPAEQIDVPDLHTPDRPVVKVTLPDVDSVDGADRVALVALAGYSEQVTGTVVVSHPGIGEHHQLLVREQQAIEQALAGVRPRRQNMAEIISL